MVLASQLTESPVPSARSLEAVALHFLEKDKTQKTMVHMFHGTPAPRRDGEALRPAGVSTRGVCKAPGSARWCPVVGRGSKFRWKSSYPPSTAGHGPWKGGYSLGKKLQWGTKWGKIWRFTDVRKEKGHQGHEMTCHEDGRVMLPPFHDLRDAAGRFRRIIEPGKRRKEQPALSTSSEEGRQGRQRMRPVGRIGSRAEQVLRAFKTRRDK